jgi:hypothetical protein
MWSLLLMLLTAGQPFASIRDVDFKNFTFPSFAGVRSVPLVNGDYCSPPDRDTCISLARVVFGDLTGDGKPEAAITLGASFRTGNGSHSTGFVYTLDNGHPRLLGRFAGGDRCGGIGNVRIRGRRLIVTRGYGGPRCTGKDEEDTFRWNGRRLVLVSSSVQPVTK